MAYDASFDAGFIVGAGIGHQFTPNIRSEAEFSYRNNEVDALILEIVPNTPFQTPLTGNVACYSGMTDLNWVCARLKSHLVPYFGAGVGIAFTEAGFENIIGKSYINQSGFAFQFVAGSSRHLSPKTLSFLEYRYFATENLRIFNANGDTGAVADDRSHGLQAGLQHRF